MTKPNETTIKEIWNAPGVKRFTIISLLILLGCILSAIGGFFSFSTGSIVFLFLLTIYITVEVFIGISNRYIFNFPFVSGLILFLASSIILFSDEYYNSSLNKDIIIVISFVALLFALNDLLLSVRLPQKFIRTIMGVLLLVLMTWSVILLSVNNEDIKHLIESYNPDLMAIFSVAIVLISMGFREHNK